MKIIKTDPKFNLQLFSIILAVEYKHLYSRWDLLNCSKISDISLSMFSTLHLTVIFNCSKNKGVYRGGARRQCPSLELKVITIFKSETE